jgi:hypothetical protein
VAQLVPHLCAPETKWIERYIWGLAPQVRGLTMGRNPKTAQEAIELSTTLTDEAIDVSAGVYKIEAVLEHNRILNL